MSIIEKIENAIATDNKEELEMLLAEWDNSADN